MVDGRLYREVEGHRKVIVKENDDGEGNEGMGMVDGYLCN